MCSLFSFSKKEFDLLLFSLTHMIGKLNFIKLRTLERLLTGLFKEFVLR